MNKSHGLLVHDVNNHATQEKLSYDFRRSLVKEPRHLENKEADNRCTSIVSTPLFSRRHVSGEILSLRHQVMSPETYNVFTAPPECGMARNTILVNKEAMIPWGRLSERKFTFIESNHALYDRGGSA